MIYPAPVAFAWSPLGALCITENSYPASKKSFIGEPTAIKKYLNCHKNESRSVNLSNDQTVSISD